MINILETTFHSSNECKENTCKIVKKDIIKIYKPDLGLKDLSLKKLLFGSSEPQLCDCIIINRKERVSILEIKCGTVTNHLLKEIIEQIENVYKILEKKGITVNKCIFVCKKFSDAMVKKRLLSKKIKSIPLTHRIYNNTAIEI